MKYIALLRGINVGGNHKVPMNELKTLFTEMGFSHIVTYINSGNVLFESVTPPDVASISSQIEQTFGFPVPTLIIDGEAMQRIARSIPAEWTNDTAQKSDVIYLFPEIDTPDIITKIGVKPDIEIFIYTPGALLCTVSRQNQAKGSLQKMIGTNLYKSMTIRNVNTARKLAEMVQA